MDTRRPSLVPEQFGPLQGVRILSTGTIVAQPFTASLAAGMLDRFFGTLGRPPDQANSPNPEKL